MRIAGMSGHRAALVLVGLLMSIAIPCVAQDQGSVRASATGTFVSRLRADPVDYQVKLTWVDAPDAKGQYTIYRSAQEITTQNVGTATVVGTVESGVQYFVDTPPDRRGYYYAVLLRDDDGTRYTAIIPFRNKTSAPVAPASQAPEESLAARVTGITAAPTPAGDGIVVGWKASNPGRDLLLFWGSDTFTSPEDLLRATATIDLDPGTTRYTVAALDGIDYSFAVVDAGMYKVGKVDLVAGTNATPAPVRVAAGAGRSSLASVAMPRRTAPLPSLAVTEGVATGRALPDGAASALPARRDVSPQTEKAIAWLLKGLAAPAAPRGAQVLRVDTTPSPDGEVSQLQEIVRGPYLGGDVAAAHKQLLDFLSLPRSREVEAHARFYLGQVYLVEGRARDALFELLVADEHYHQESAPWIDACFMKLEAEE